MTLRLQECTNNHPNKLSEELANLLGEPADTFININNIITKLRTYCEANCRIVRTNNISCSIYPNAQLMRLMSEVNYLRWRDIDHWISYYGVIYCLQENGHIQMYIPNSDYVLK
jgi:hypothetical protein